MMKKDIFTKKNYKLWLQNRKLEDEREGKK